MALPGLAASRTTSSHSSQTTAVSPPTFSSIHAVCLLWELPILPAHSYSATPPWKHLLTIIINVCIL
jgi:hypothetical protein